MKRLIPLAAGTLLLLLGALLAPATGNDNKLADDTLVSPYFPLKVGTTWEYLSGGKTIVLKVAAHEQIDGQTCARLETDSGGRVTEHLTVKEDGIYRVRANGQDLKPPVLVLKLPPAKGDSWSVDSAVQNFALKGKLIMGEEKLTVGQAEYATFSVKSSEMTMGGQGVSMESWYAKDIGMVKQHFRLPAADYDVVLELTKFSAGK